MTSKLRLSATVDADLMEAGQRAVREGAADSISAWVNEALRRQADHETRMRALDEFMAAYEAEHGAFTDDELAAATRRARAGAIVVRPEA